MDMDMYSHPATQKNIQILKSYGNIFVEAATGELASGLSGKGRMEEPENILQHVVNLFLAANRFNGYKVLITSGPTYEPIDPVRFIGNYSSGKMGTAIATAIAQQGAQVTFITGPAAVEPQHPSVKIVRVKTASEMLEQAKNEFDSCQVAILAAAVADFAPANTSTDKIKRGKENLDLQLEPTTDIAETLGKMKRQNQIIVGFALETHNEVENAIDKLTRKNLDIIVLNSLNDAGAGFGHNTNKITLIDRNGKQKSFELKPKSEVAQDIANAIIDLLQQAK